MSASNRPAGGTDTAARGYRLLCLLGLLGLVLGLLLRDLGAWSMLPLLAGSLSLARGWRSGPLLVLGALGLVLGCERIGLTPLDLFEWLVRVPGQVVAGRGMPVRPVRQTFGLRGQLVIGDFLMGAAAVVYAAAHYRLLALTRPIFPAERLPRPARPALGERPPAAESVRPEKTVGPHEMLWLLVVAPAWVLSAAYVWSKVQQQRTPALAWPAPVWKALYPELPEAGERVFLDLRTEVWQAVLLAWLLGLGAIVAAAVIGYLGQRRMSAPEAALYLQDTLWRETCREQRQLNRWLARARLRRRHREDGK